MAGPAESKRGREIGQLHGPLSVGALAGKRRETVANRYPGRAQFDRVPELIREWIVPGHAPPAGMLSTSDTVLTFGSCFARDLRMSLERLGLASNNLLIPSGLNNTCAILDFVSWCVTGEETERGFRYDRSAEGEIDKWKPTAEREKYLREFKQAGAFIFAVTLAEVWEDRLTGGVFWRGVPEEIFDAGRQLFRVSSVEENEANLRQIIELVRTINPDAPIVLMLAPGSLKATFDAVSCLTADCVSKSILRVALDRVEKLGLKGVFYWPSFETVRWAGAHFRWRAYTYGRGRDALDARHASLYLIAAFMDAFVAAFYAPASVAQLQARRGRVEHPPRSIRGRLQALGAAYDRRKVRTLRRARKSLRTALQGDRRARRAARTPE